MSSRTELNVSEVFHSPITRRLGRPKYLNGFQRGRNFYLNDQEFETLRDIGRGNASDGLMQLIREHRERLGLPTSVAE